MYHSTGKPLVYLGTPAGPTRVLTRAALKEALRVRCYSRRQSRSHRQSRDRKGAGSPAGPTRVLTRAALTEALRVRC